MPINIPLTYSPEILNRCTHSSKVPEAIRQVMYMNGAVGELAHDNARRFVLLKLLEMGATSVVMSYLLGEGLIAGV